MSRSLRSVRFIAAASVALTTSACAVLLDFEEAHDMSPAAITTDDQTTTNTSNEAGPTATVPPTTDAAGSDSTDASTSSDVTQEKAIIVTPEECSTCVATPPTGWQGPLAIYQGPGTGGASPSCGGDYPLSLYDGFSGPVGSPAQCTCSCDAPTGVACSAPVATYFGNNTCSSGCSGSSSQGLGATCTTLTDGYCSGPRFSVGASTASGGSCAPVLAKAIPATTFTNSVRLCASPTPATRSTCTSPTDVCAPRASAPFNTQKVCIARAGDWACPVGYPISARYHDSVTDTRSCSACSCGSPTGSTCGGNVTMFKSDEQSGGGGGQCSLPKATLALPVNCTSVGSYDRASVTVNPSGGSCTPSGGAPTGDVTPNVAMTVCCVN